jgi:hypothetical protein
MSHVAVINDRKAVVWFGRLSQKALAKEQVGVEIETKTCKRETEKGSMPGLWAWLS